MTLVVSTLYVTMTEKTDHSLLVAPCSNIYPIFLPSKQTGNANVLVFRIAKIFAMPNEINALTLNRQIKMQNTVVTYG